MTGSGVVDLATEADPVIVVDAAGHVSTTGETDHVIVTEGIRTGAVVVVTTQETVVPTRKTTVTLKSEIKW